MERSSASLSRDVSAPPQSEEAEPGHKHKELH